MFYGSVFYVDFSLQVFPVPASYFSFCLSSSSFLVVLFLRFPLVLCRCGGIGFVAWFVDAASTGALRDPPGSPCEGTLWITFMQRTNAFFRRRVLIFAVASLMLLIYWLKRLLISGWQRCLLICCPERLLTYCILASLLCIHTCFFPKLSLHCLYVVFFVLNILVCLPVVHLDILDVEWASVAEVEVKCCPPTLPLKSFVFPFSLPLPSAGLCSSPPFPFPVLLLQIRQRLSSKWSWMGWNTFLSAKTTAEAVECLKTIQRRSPLSSEIVQASAFIQVFLRDQRP